MATEEPYNMTRFTRYRIRYQMKILPFLLMFCLTTVVTADTQIPDWQSHVIASSIKESILNMTARGETDEVSGLLQALGLLKTSNTDRVLVELSDYYFGEAIGEDMNSVITYRGQEILPFLHSYLGNTISCVPNVHCLTQEERDDRIKIWIDLIEKGEKVEFVP